MSNKIHSVLVFPYANSFEVRVSRSDSFDKPPSSIRVYSRRYDDNMRVKRLAQLANRLNGLVMNKMIDARVCVSSPIK